MPLPFPLIFPLLSCSFISYFIFVTNSYLPFKAQLQVLFICSVFSDLLFYCGNKKTHIY